MSFDWEKGIRKTLKESEAEIKGAISKEQCSVRLQSVMEAIYPVFTVLIKI